MMIVVKIFSLVMLIVFSLAWAEEPLVIKPGVWPEDIKYINGAENNRDLVFSSRNIMIDAEQLIEPTIIKIDKNAVVYFSSTTQVRAKPKVYTHPELANEVEKFYLQGVGNYAFWATLIGVSAFVK